MATLGNIPRKRVLPGGACSRILVAAATTGMIVVTDGTDPNNATPSTSAGQTGILGVITTDQGDPNNSGQFAIGDIVDVCDRAAPSVPVQLVAGTYTSRQPIIASGTTGAGKALASETGTIQILGYYDDVPQTTSATQALAVSLHLQTIKL